jgi:predicted MPP superfamily phosphohydrolase
MHAVQMVELIRVFLFVAALATTFVLAARTLVQMARERFGRAVPPARHWVLWSRRFILGVGTLGVFCVLYGWLVEPYWLAVTRVRIATPKLSAGARPVRIVHISDLHCDPKVRLEERLPDVVAAEKPDLIVFTGDAINSPEGLPNFKRCLTRLAGLAPTFVVKGNWDAWYWSDLDLYGGTGARELNGDATEVVVGNASIWLSGVPVDGEARIPRAIDAMPAGAFRVFLYHYPDEIPTVAARRVDLYCAGHTHGGQVALPLYGALLTLSRFGKRYEAGLYQVESTGLYVSRGIGMEGGPQAPRVRFCARPEVTVIEVAPRQ